MLGFDGLNAVGKIAKIIEQMADDSGLKEKFAAEGAVSGLVQIEEYQVEFTIRRLEDD